MTGPKVKLQTLLAVLAASTTIVSARTASPVRAEVGHVVSEDDCPGSYCVGELWEGCCFEPTFVCCTGTENYCSADLQYCPPSYLTGNPDFSKISELVSNLFKEISP